MEFTQAAYSAVGKRYNNEDSVSTERVDGGLLAVVADGLGGHSFGEQASREAVRVLIEQLGGQIPSARELERAIDRADSAVRVLQRDYPGCMTTVAALWLHGERAYAGHVGDTRVYQFRGGQIIYQSEDHSLAQLAVKNGEIRPEEVRGYPERNVLFRALGGRGETRPCIRELSLRAGDRLLLCSDGFWESLTEREMLQAASRTETAQEWLMEMRQSVEPEADDNNTAAAIVVNSVRGERAQ